MNRPRNQLLTRARLAQNKHRGVGRRDGFHLLQDSFQSGRVPNNLFELACGDQLFLEVTLFFLAASQRFLEALSFRKIANHYKNNRPVLSFIWPKQDVDRKFAAVFAATEEV